MIDRARYARQMQLAEVGETGQARIAAGVAAVVGAGLSHEIATAYAARAGMGQLVAGPIDQEALAPAFLENAAARAVVAGSRAALACLRAALRSKNPGGGPAP